MTVQGLLDILAELLPGGQLAEWSIASLDQLRIDDGEWVYALTIQNGPVLYRLQSYIPPEGIKDILRRKAL